MAVEAQDLLVRLLHQGEEKQAGVRSRAPTLTTHDMAPYRKSRSLEKRENFEAAMKAARAAGAVDLHWDIGDDPFICRVTLRDIEMLARHLGRPLASARLEAARSALAPWVHQFPVLTELLSSWERLRSPRGLLPESAPSILDACRVLAALNNRPTPDDETPLRVFSQRLFNDTKHIELLAPALSLLTVGSLEGPALAPNDLWQELGLLKEPQPVRMAGDVVVARARVTARLDTPYAAFPAEAVLGINGAERVLTIENLTTFHTEARRSTGTPQLLLYTAGMPSPAWRAMYRRILQSLPPEVPLFHWGDLDEGGLRIAAKLAEEARAVERTLQYWPAMHPALVPEALRVPAKTHTVDRMCRYALQAGWSHLVDPICQGRFTVEQEALSHPNL